ncbi:MAG TPA: methyltransferase domain-containing protein [Acidimicrobiia bacterium]|nr:methyltransferase domain-containing protein [Acidimicrobiia bacterium]
MVHHQFADATLAALYDAFCPWDQRQDFAFYLPLVMAADSVLDVGCGTGALLHRARDTGHTGRLRGLDPAPGMLAQAQRRADIDWTLGDLASVPLDERFDLVLMTGHAFQVLVDDAELRTALTAIRSALTDHGRFAFETRNPTVREWEQWTSDRATEATDAAGTVVRMDNQIDTPIVGDRVRFTTTYRSPRWDQPQLSHSTLRFLDAPDLARFLTDAGLIVDEQFGDWDRSALTETSPEIITISRRA